MKRTFCPKCKSNDCVKHRTVLGRQRYWCKDCNYRFSVFKEGKGLEKVYVVKAIQLYLEGITLREIEKILGVSHVTVLKWIKQYGNNLDTIRYEKNKVMQLKELHGTEGTLHKNFSEGLLLTGISNKIWVIEEKKQEKR